MGEWLKKLSLSRANSLILWFSAGFILLASGIFFYRSGLFEPEVKVEVLDAGGETKADLVVEIAGEVIKPGVYKLPSGSRVEDLLVAAGGLAAGADRLYLEKYLNRAAKLADGQKVYIPTLSVNGYSRSGEASAKKSDYVKPDQGILGVSQTGLVNINTASLAELDKLPGIGPVYGQSIIDHRPYSNTEELVAKGALKQSVYEKIKDQITVY